MTEERPDRSGLFAEIQTGTDLKKAGTANRGELLSDIRTGGSELHATGGTVNRGDLMTDIRGAHGGGGLDHHGTASRGDLMSEIRGAHGHVHKDGEGD